MGEIRIQLVCADYDPDPIIPCGGEVKLRLCPFEHDVCNREVWVILCDEHEFERAMEI